MSVPQDQTPDSERLTCVTTVEVVETQARKLQFECRQMIALAAQCPEVHPDVLQDLNHSLSSSANLLNYLSDIKSINLKAGHISSRLLGAGAGLRCH